jgi:hypothetical protein
VTVPEIFQSPVAGFNVRVWALLPAVTMAVCALETAAIVAVKPAVDAPGGIFTLVGTTTFELLLERATLIPPAGDGALRVIVQAEVAGALMLTGVQVSPLTVAWVAPLTKMVPPVPEDGIALPADVDATAAT